MRNLRGLELALVSGGQDKDASPNDGGGEECQQTTTTVTVTTRHFSWPWGYQTQDESHTVVGDDCNGNTVVDSVEDRVPPPPSTRD